MSVSGLVPVPLVSPSILHDFLRYLDTKINFGTCNPVNIISYGNICAMRVEICVEPMYIYAAKSSSIGAHKCIIIISAQIMITLSWLSKDIYITLTCSVGVNEGCFTLIVVASLNVNLKWVHQAWLWDKCYSLLLEVVLIGNWGRGARWVPPFFWGGGGCILICVPQCCVSWG